MTQTHAFSRFLAYNVDNPYDKWADRDLSAGPNEAAIREVLTFIDLHRDRWNQDQYLGIGECGMVGCFAGWAMVLHAFGEDVGDLLDRSAPEAMNDVRRIGSKFRLLDLLGLTTEQFNGIYDFVNVNDPGLGYFRHPTFEELCERVEQVTGVRYKNGEQP